MIRTLDGYILSRPAQDVFPSSRSAPGPGCPPVPGFAESVSTPRHILKFFALAGACFLAGCSTLPPSETKAAAELKGTGLAQADELISHARNFSGQQEIAAIYRLRAAEIAWDELSSLTGTVEDVATLPEPQQHALRILATSAGGLAPLFVGDKAVPVRTFDFAGHHYRVNAARADKTGVYPPARLASVKLASQVPHKLVRNWHIEAGAGAPLSPTWKAPTDPRMKRFVGRRGYIEPLTVVLDFSGPTKSGTVRTATLTGYDPTAVSRVHIGRSEYPLAADFTAPIVDRTVDINEFRLAIGGLLFADAREAQLGILEPYDSSRVPVVLVHGLNSHPRMWRNVINDLRADPELRGRYQFWVFYYPTGAPIAYSALRLREELAALDRVIGPQHDMVLVGHSLGGLVSRMQVISPGRAIWDAQLKGDADRLYKSLPRDSLLKRAMLFQANPEISREVYICVPHRGSGLADMSLAAWFGSLVRLPSKITHTAATLPGSVAGNRRLNSIAGLSPTNPLFAALDKIPIAVPHHSIIGDRGKGGHHDKQKPVSSDGVVPYWSSHLDSAQSELIVPGPHGSYNRPDAIAELKRILKLHLTQSSHMLSN